MAVLHGFRRFAWQFAWRLASLAWQFVWQFARLAWHFAWLQAELVVVHGTAFGMEQQHLLIDDV